MGIPQESRLRGVETFVAVAGRRRTNDDLQEPPCLCPGETRVHARHPGSPVRRNRGRRPFSRGPDALDPSRPIEPAAIALAAEEPTVPLDAQE